MGGSGDIAVGAALYKKINRKPGIGCCQYMGDASMACGPVREGITFAAMDQFKQLWEGDMKGGLLYDYQYNEQSVWYGRPDLWRNQWDTEWQHVSEFGGEPEQMHVNGWMDTTAGYNRRIQTET